MDRLRNRSLCRTHKQENIFSLHNSHIPHKPKRASFATKESLFFLKVGKVTFSARKSLPCRYSALSLHSKTVGKWPISDSFSRCASTLPSLCLRSAFALGSLWVRFRRRRKTQGNAAAETRHKQEVFDIFAYRISSRPGGWHRSSRSEPRPACSTVTCIDIFRFTTEYNCNTTGSFLIVGFWNTLHLTSINHSDHTGPPTFQPSTFV